MLTIRMLIAFLCMIFTFNSYAEGQQNVWVVCAAKDFKPMIFMDESGKWKGFDYDILQAIAKDKGVNLTFKDVSLKGIWLLPNKGECDIAAVGLAATPKRLKEGAVFTKSYFTGNSSLLIRKEDQNKYSSIADLQGKTIGVIEGSTGAAIVEAEAKKGTKIKSYKSPNGMIDDLKSGKVDAFVRSSTSADSLQKSNPDVLLITIVNSDQDVGFVVKKPLKETIDAKIDEMKKSGKIDELINKWFKG